MEVKSIDKNHIQASIATKWKCAMTIFLDVEQSYVMKSYSHN
jgi:hypothetical protein